MKMFIFRMGANILKSYFHRNGLPEKEAGGNTCVCTSCQLGKRTAILISFYRPILVVCQNLSAEAPLCQNLSAEAPLPFCQVSAPKPVFPSLAMLCDKWSNSLLPQPQHGASCWGLAFPFCFFLASRNTFSALLLAIS